MEKFLVVEYRGEGNCAIVFAKPQTYQVYRLLKNNATRKIKKLLQNCSGNGDHENFKNIQYAVRKELDNVVSYVNNIMRPLLTERYVVTSLVTSIPRGLGEKAITLAEQARPAHRKHSKSDAVDSDIQYALVLPDCCFVRHQESGISEQNVDSSHISETDESFDSATRSNSDEMLKENQKLSRSSSGDSDLESDSAGENKCIFGIREDSELCSDKSFDYNDELDDSVSHICDSFDGKNVQCDHIYYTKARDYYEKEKLSDCQLKPGVSNDNTNFTLSIEIKPKKAFMTKSSNDSSNMNQVCRFCMHQHLKRKSGQWPQTSSYCPLDLFSGNRHRMKHALFSLIKTPQNNLKICKNGKEVYGSDIRKDLGAIFQDWFPANSGQRQMLLSVFLDLVIEILLDPGSCDRGSDCQTSTPGLQRCENSSFVHNDDDQSQGLPRSCVLERIYSLQSLDDLDIEGVFPLYARLKQKMEQDPCLGNRWCLNGPYNDLTWLFGHPDLQLADLDSESDDYAVMKVKRFLVSKTLQDCSIIVAIKPALESVHGKRNFLRFEGDLYDFSISVVDLDPKPFEKVKTYYRQATDIAVTFAETSHKISSQFGPNKSS